VHQPGDYVSAVSKDLARYVNTDLGGYIENANNYDRYVTDLTIRYYKDGPGFAGAGPAPLRAYARTVITEKWLLLLLILLPAASIAVTRDLERRGAVVFAATGWLLLLGAVATANYDPRYGEVATGSLAAGAAPAIRYVTARAGGRGVA
jgi:hypothetical protein